MKLIFLVLTILLLGCVSTLKTEQQNQSTVQINEFPGDNFSRLVELNTPLECDISYLHQGKLYPSKVYLKGGSDMRVEIVGGSGLSQCTKTISIVQGDKIYFGCENKTILPGCDWFSSDYDQKNPGRSATFDFTLTRASEINCRRWSFDLQKVATPGKVCSLSN